MHKTDSPAVSHFSLTEALVILAGSSIDYQRFSSSWSEYQGANSTTGKLCKRAGSVKCTQFHNAEELHGMPWLLWVGRAELAVNVIQPGSSTNPQRKDGFSTHLIQRAAHKLLLRFEEAQSGDLQRIQRKQSKITVFCADNQNKQNEVDNRLEDNLSAPSADMQEIF